MYSMKQFCCHLSVVDGSDLVGALVDGNIRPVVLIGDVILVVEVEVVTVALVIVTGTVVEGVEECNACIEFCTINVVSSSSNCS